MASQVFVKANSIEENNSIQKNNNSLILVGDSRTYNMSKWVDTEVSTKFVAKSGEGYQWFIKEAIDNVNKIKKPGDVIVIWLGVNDYSETIHGINTWSIYSDKINSLATNEWADCKVYVASVGYIDSNKMITYYGLGIKANFPQLALGIKIRWIMEFNENLRTRLNENVTWIDTYDVIGIKIDDKVNTPNNIWVTRLNGKKDGLHYSKVKTQEIYNYFVEKTMM